MELSDQQQKAVAHSGSPALVVAGAGSGKTRTLTAKFCNLIQNGYLPERILAITFTNKAADEMKARLVQSTGLRLSHFPWVRTYHSACFRILKEHCRDIHYTPPLQIYAVHQQQKTIKDILVEKLNVDKKHVMAVLSRISNAKNSGNPEKYFDHHPRVAQIRLSDVYSLYTQSLKAKNAVDFDDILLLTRNLLRDHDPVRNKIQALFDYLLVDEYQDTNNLQEELTRLLLKGGNLFCVGDDWQAIYSFRGSNVDHFLSFKEKFQGAAVYRLEQNFRSVNEIVQVANDLIGYNDRRMDKHCFSRKEGGVVELHQFSDEHEESNWVAKKIRSLHEMGLSRHQMAVLYRTKFCSLSFEQAFRAWGIPYQMIGGKGFFDRKEIMDINSFLTAATFEKDDVSFERIVNTPKRGIGPGTIKKIAMLKNDHMSLQEATRKALSEKIFSPKIYAGLELIITLLDDIREMSPDAAIREILGRTGYLDYLIHYCGGNTIAYTSRVENIEQLIWSAARKETILDYLEEAALVREDSKDDEKNTGITLSTIHASKGLEFKTVFVVGCEEQLFPHWRSLDSDSGLEEERRLMYVSITRAEHYLYLSSATFRKGQYNHRSRFLDEIETSLES
jgi:DNA helicase II / ATP-dependent DNA helicase PcrA